MLLENVSVFTGDGFSPANWAVRVSGSVISEVGPGLVAQPGETVKDLGGLWLIPGLINCHAHIAIDDADLAIPRKHYRRGELLGLLEASVRGRRTLEAGITTVRDCNGPGLGVFALRTAFEEGLLPGPRIVASAQAICATGGHMHAISFEADGPDAVRRGVRQQIKAGADFIKLVAEASSSGGALERPALQLTIEEMAAGVDTAHRLGKRVTAHAVSALGVAGAVAAGVDCIEHGYGTSDETLDLMAESGVWLVPTLSVQKAILERGMEAGLDRALVERSRGYLERGLATVARAREKGVLIACGSDAGSPLNPMTDLVTELSLLVEAGFSEIEAITAATRKAAELIGIEDRIGFIEPGKTADLAVLGRDPGRSIGAVRDVVLVMKGGEVVSERGPQSDGNNEEDGTK